MVGIATKKNSIQLYMENICVYHDPNERQAILTYLEQLDLLQDVLEHAGDVEGVNGVAGRIARGLHGHRVRGLHAGRSGRSGLPPRSPGRPTAPAARAPRAARRHRLRLNSSRGCGTPRPSSRACSRGTLPARPGAI